MQPLTTTYDVAITGGGLAGLALAIQLAQKKHRVVLFEKEKYPFHKVCGEYISMESWGFLQSLGLPLADLQLPHINSFILTAPNGSSFRTELPLGGFGISRFTADSLLANLAKNKGVAIVEEAKVEEINFEEGKYSVRFSSHQPAGTNEIKAAVCCGAFGKRSNLDVKWKRSFIANKNPRQNNYVGIKYHIKTSWPEDLIGLHNFSDGYCGISKIEADKYCLCYLTTATNLKKAGSSIQQMQEETLYKNPALKKLFLNSEFLADFPVVISQISFSKKPLIENGVLMLGDAAGMIAPLCGNGMSMALHASKMAAICIDAFLSGTISRQLMEENYKAQWEKEFSTRLKAGRILQGFFGSASLSNFFVSVFKTLPFLAQTVIRTTHGKAF